MRRFSTLRPRRLNKIAAFILSVLVLGLVLPHVFPLEQSQAAVTYSKPRVCVYASGGGALNATVSITGYSPVVVNGCRDYTFVSGKSVTISAAASGYYSQSKSVYLGVGSVPVTFYLQPIPPAVQYTNLTVCTKNVNTNAAVNSSIAIQGYSTVVTGSDGCNSYTFVRNKTLNISAIATGYKTGYKSVYISNANQTAILYLEPLPPPIKYSALTICIEGDQQKGLKGTIAINGYSTEETNSNGCRNYTFQQGKTLTATARVTGYGSLTKSFTIPQKTSHIEYFRFTGPPQTNIVTLTIKTIAATGQSAPISGATVYVCPSSTSGSGNATCPSKSTNSSGIATFEVSKNSTLSLSAAKDALSGSTNLSIGTTNKSVTLTMQSPSKNYKITGKVTNAAGNPITSATIKATNLSTGKIFSTSSLSTGILGSYTLNITENGTYSLEAVTSAPNYQGARSYPNITFSDSSVTSVTRNFSLTAASGKYVVKGSITEAKTGKAVKGAGVHLHNKTTNSWIVASSNSDGKYVIYATGDGTYALEITPGDNTHLQGAFARPDFVFNSSSAKEITKNITLQPKPVPSGCIANSALCITPSTSKRVTGRIVTATNTLYKGQVDLLLENTRTGTTARRTTSTGIFSFDNLNAARETYTLTASPQDGSPVISQNPLTLTVDAGQTYAATFTVSSSSTSGPDNDTGTGGNDNGSSGGANTDSGNGTNNPPTSSVTRKITGQVWIKNGSSNKQKYTGRLNVTAKNKSNQTKTVKTNNDGSYEIPNLTQSEYVVSITAPSSTKLESPNNVSITFNAQTSKSVDFTLVSTITPSPSFSPSPTISIVQPSPSTTTPSTVVSPSPTTPSPSPTLSPVPGGVTVKFTNILLHGLGNAGDNAARGGKGNFDPVRPQRQILVEITSLTDQTFILSSGRGIVSFDKATGAFKGDVTLDTPLPQGSYFVSVSIPTYLSQRLANAIAISGVSSVTISEDISLTTGDINLDDKIDILDYDLLITCDETIPTNTCDLDHPEYADLNDDGLIDPKDYNLYLREISTVYGDN